VAHESGEREFIHARHGGPRPERVTPAIELEGLEFRLLERGLMGVLERSQMSRLAAAEEYEWRLLQPRFCRLLPPQQDVLCAGRQGHAAGRGITLPIAAYVDHAVGSFGTRHQIDIRPQHGKQFFRS
jgi:hypothetical protein